MAKKLSKAKAKEMLKNPPHNKPLTDKQRKYFGYIANANLGTIIEDNAGQLKYPGKITKINSPKITMKGVKDTLLGVSDLGDTKVMYPEQDYLFNGSNVTEFPLGESGVHTMPDGTLMLNSKMKKYAQGGGLKRSKDYGSKKKPYPSVKSNDFAGGDRSYPIPTKADAVDALRLAGLHNRSDVRAKVYKKYPELKKGQQGVNLGPKKFLFDQKVKMKPIEQELAMRTITGNNPMFLPTWAHPDREWMGSGHQYIDDAGNLQTKPIYKKKAQYGITEPIQTNWGSENIFIPDQFSVQGQAQQFSNTLPQQGGILEDLGGASGILNTATNLIGGFQMLKQDKENRNEAKQFYKLSKLINEASSLPVDKPKRKYFRPEDQVIDPEILSNTYGVGTNYLEDGGQIEYQDGGVAPFFQQLGSQFNQLGYGRTGNLGEMLGSAIGGGGGIPSGASNIGSTLGGIAGSLIGPIGAPLGSFIGGTVGGLIGGNTQRDTAKYQRKGQRLLGQAAFQQGSQQIHNQYTGFMEHGGNIKTHWGGYADPISVNPYLPEDGTSILFRGNSHTESDGKGNSGIGVTFGKTPVEVEGGEPAVKLDNGLTVFGDMNIPDYGVVELNDPKAKGKKFKNYINDLNEMENKQNKITDDSIVNINDNPMATSFDKLEMSSNEAMLIGANMNLKNIANKKQIASNVQKAILDTAKEFNLDSSELSRGKIKKARRGIRMAQQGDYVLPTRVSREDAETLKMLENLGFKPVENDPNRLFRTLNIPGKETINEYGPYKAGSVAFQKAFGTARKQGLEEFTFGKKKFNTDLYGKRTSKNISPGSSKTDYVDIYDLDKRPLPSLTNIEPFKIPSRIPSQTPVNIPQGGNKGDFDWMNLVNTTLPYLRPTNQSPLDSGQLSGEMFALATNQLEPVQAQLYNPLLEQVSDISLQDQLNLNQADFNSLQRSLIGNPAALAALAGQKYQANTGVLGEQFRLNQGQRQGTYNRNRATLNDAQLKNLGILDQQYVRQSEAKSKTKAVAKSALDSIANKIAQNKLENKTLGIYENLYNYRFGPKGYAYNLNPLFTPNIPQVGEDLPLYDSNDSTLTVEEYRQKYDRIGNPSGSERRSRVTKKGKNGTVVKALKNSRIKGY